MFCSLLLVSLLLVAGFVLHMADSTLQDNLVVAALSFLSNICYEPILPRSSVLPKSLEGHGTRCARTTSPRLWRRAHCQHRDLNGAERNEAQPAIGTRYGTQGESTGGGI